MAMTHSRDPSASATLKREKRLPGAADVGATVMSSRPTPWLRPGSLECSIAAVAMSRGVNANLLRRWVAEAERDGHDVAIEPAVVEAPSPAPAAPAPTFVPMALPPPSPVAAADIRVELRRGGTAITVTWPSSAATECASWMRELLK